MAIKFDPEYELIQNYMLEGKVQEMYDYIQKIKNSSQLEPPVILQTAVDESKIKVLQDYLTEWKYGKRNPYKPLYIADIVMTIESLFNHELEALRLKEKFSSLSK